jgi:signal transduction histidine kinase
MIGRKPFDYMPADEAKRVAAVFEQAAEEGRPILNIENTNLHKDGRPVVLETSGVPVFDALGNLRGYRGIDRDITRRREVESERLGLERRLLHAQKLESLGILAGGIAHDFNNLLTAMMGHAELGLLKMGPDDPARGNILSIVKTARRAADLSSQMLAYSGKGKFVIESVNLNGLIAEMSRLLSVSVAKGADLRCEFAENVPAVEGDATQIRQVLMNLVTNASEAIVNGNGEIVVSTGAEECRRDYLDAENPAFRAGVDAPLAEGTYVYLQVRDSGCGMDPQMLERIFDPFFSTKFTGRGLGMAAVAGIVRGHRGAIKIRSEVNRGTTFRVLFPAGAKGADSAPAAGKKTAEAAGSGRGTVLPADDEEPVRAVRRALDSPPAPIPPLENV